ncbi:MAG: DUF3348 family protein [Rhodocyclaceae bacterium]|nr:DUF3348 family protein [Rhodocyclaceae bacterium]
MTRPPPHTGFGRPRLIRLLAGLVAGEGAEARRSLAERLGGWLNLTDAIALSGALAVGGGDESATPGEEGAGVALVRVRAALADSIAADEGRGGVALSAAPDFAPFRRHYVARQRDMAAAIGPLRAQARQALAARSPALARLAALDAVMERALAERERALLGSVPHLLERRFERLRAAPPADAGAASDGWLAAFCREQRDLLLAELEFRLLPVDGLVAASADGGASF